VDTIDIIKEIVRNDNNITGIYVHTFPCAPGLEDRIHFTKLERTHYNVALKLREKHHVPFWDALMLSFYNKKKYSERIFENILNSHAKRIKRYISREELLNTSIINDLKNSNENYALNSKVETISGKKNTHLLLLDFHIPENVNNQLIVENICKLLKLKTGYLLKSGKSYHFIGNNIISTYKLISFISKCLFFTPIIDKSWIAHQLIDKSCSLRFTKKHEIFPTLIKVFQR
jgi:hypothetical protein